MDDAHNGSEAVSAKAIANLALATGNVGVPNAGVIPLYQGANEQGAYDMGVSPSALPGHEPVSDAEASERFRANWGAEVPSAPGVSAAEAFEAARQGRMRSMLLLGDHTHYEDGTFGDVGAALDKLAFLVVTDGFMSSIAQKADVVFPALQPQEKVGTYTNMERRVQPLRRVLAQKKADVRSDLDVLGAIAKTIGAPGFEDVRPEFVLAEVGGLVEEYRGITYERLMAEGHVTAKPSNDNPQPTQVLYSEFVRHGLQWPCTSGDSPGAQRLYENGYRGAKAMLAEIPWVDKPTAAKDFPLALAHGRVLMQAEREMEIENVDGLNRIRRDEDFVLHPSDATDLGAEDGDVLRAVSDSGHTFEGIARIADSVPAGMLSLTTLFGELATELQASDRPDAMNHIPRLSTQLVRVEKRSARNA
jgi:predicted molibdopterin-dependent oxidoreductase YjgC